MDYTEDAFEWSLASFEFGIRDSYDSGKFCALSGPPRNYDGKNPHALVERGGFLVRCPRCFHGATPKYCDDGCAGGSFFSAGAVLDFVLTDAPSASITVIAKEEEWFTKPIYQKIGWSKGKSVKAAVIERKRKRQHAEHEHVKKAPRTVVFEGIVPYNISLLNAMVQDDLSTTLVVGQPLYATNFCMTLTDEPDSNNAFVGTYFGAIPESPGEIYVLLAAPVVANNFVGLLDEQVELVVPVTGLNALVDRPATLLSITRLPKDETWEFQIDYIDGSGTIRQEYWARSNDDNNTYKTNTDKTKKLDDFTTDEIVYTNPDDPFFEAPQKKNRILKLSKKDKSPFVLPLF